MKLYRKCSAKPYSFLVIENTIALDNRLSLQKINERSIDINHDI